MRRPRPARPHVPRKNPAPSSDGPTDADPAEPLYRLLAEMAEEAAERGGGVPHETSDDPAAARPARGVRLHVCEFGATVVPDVEPQPDQRKETGHEA